MRSVKRRWVSASAGSLVFWSLLAPSAFADDAAKQLIGTWKLTAWTVQVIGEDSREPYGPNPKGRLVVTPEGHWIVILTGANRRPGKTNDEKAGLLDSMFAYSGKYRIEGDKVTTRVDMSSNEIYSGANQDQTRFFRIEGDKLELRVPEIASAVLPGKRVAGLLRWERER
jgi:lipocalin-like protein